MRRNRMIGCSANNSDLNNTSEKHKTKIDSKFDCMFDLLCILV